MGTIVWIVRHKDLNYLNALWRQTMFYIKLPAHKASPVRTGQSPYVRERTRTGGYSSQQVKMNLCYA